MVYDIASILATWEQFGVFDFFLPFLLLFAVVFGILDVTQVFGKGNKAINIIIAFVVGLLALQWGLVPQFFRELFPRLGVGIASLLALMILVAMFIPDSERRGWWTYGFGVIAVIVGIVVVSKSFGWIGVGTTLSGDIVSWLVLAVVGIGLIIAVAVSGSKGGDLKGSYGPIRN